MKARPLTLLRWATLCTAVVWAVPFVRWLARRPWRQADEPLGAWVPDIVPPPAVVFLSVLVASTWVAFAGLLLVVFGVDALLSRRGAA